MSKFFFTGCVDQLRINEAPTPKSLFERYNDVYLKRKELVKFVFDSNDDGVLLLNLPVVSGAKKSMEAMFEVQNDILTKLDNTTDFTTGTVQNLVDSFSDNVQYMVENDGLFQDGHLYSMFQNMKERMKNVLARMPISEKSTPTDIRVRFSYKVIL